jgi:hypothetical protein
MITPNNVRLDKPHSHRGNSKHNNKLIRGRTTRGVNTALDNGANSNNTGRGNSHRLSSLNNNRILSHC